MLVPEKRLSAIYYGSLKKSARNTFIFSGDIYSFKYKYKHGGNGLTLK